MIAAFIIGCEIGFWVFVLAGLACRYMLHMKKTGAILLILTPVVDLVLVVATIIDLRSGSTATFMHGLAAIYIGVSVAFGHRMVRWADMKFAERFAGGPAPQPKPKYGKEHARSERQAWLRYLLAYVVGCLILLAMIIMVGDPEQTEALMNTIRIWSIILVIDFLYSFSFTLWPRKEKKSASF